LRVPLSSLIEYKGFVVLALAHSKISSENVLMGNPKEFK
jgi:hypothetical protein